MRTSAPPVDSHGRRALEGSSVADGRMEGRPAAGGTRARGDTGGRWHVGWTGYRQQRWRVAGAERAVVAN
jgi:hypothetical protein